MKYSKNNNYKKNNKKGSFKMTNKTKSLLVTVGMILLIFGLLMGITAIRNNINKNNAPEGFEFHDVTWKRGGINEEDGSMKFDDSYIYSSAINVEDTFKVERTFGSGVAFKVYYYDELDRLVYQDEDFTVSEYTKDINTIEVDEGASIHHIRIVCKNINDDNEKLSFFERRDLAKAIKVYVSVEEVTEE